MKSQLMVLAVLAGLTMSASADGLAEKPSAAARPAELKTTLDELPKGISRFNGMLLGRLAAKDIEKGTFVVLVDAVPRVWKNNQADDPKGLVGKTVEVGGVFGKFLDVLVVMRIGETIEFECKHDGERLKFPGEMLRKVAPYKPEDYPVLPEAFRGFQGSVVAEVAKKDQETFEMIVNVDHVVEAWKDNGAKQPKSIEGKPLMLIGFWNRRDDYHNLQVGDRIEVGMQHVGLRSDHLNVAQTIRKVTDDESSGAMKPSPAAAEKKKATGEPSKEFQGFRGQLVGRLVEKDVERGTFRMVVDAVPRVWNNNGSSNPKGFVGRNVDVEGVHGKLLDVLVVTRVGETVEVGAAHDGGERIRLMEGFRKTGPVKPGDYPELPDDFRGFKGTLVGKVVKKNEHALELIVEIQKIDKASQESKAKQAESVIGRQVMLAGFWQRKDNYHSLSVDDLVQCSVEHPQLLSDHLSATASVEKVAK